MTRWLILALCLFGLPRTVLAQAPERLLAPASQVYVCWDGVDKHQAEYARTALGKIFAGDSGRLLQHLLEPYKAQELYRLLDGVGKHGVVMGVEVRRLDPPEAQLTAVFPGAKSRADSVSAGLRWLVEANGGRVREARVMGRSVHRAVNAPLAWWVEGDDVVLIAGHDAPEQVLERFAKDKKGLTDHPLLKKVNAFREFKTTMRGFVDVAGALELALKVNKDAAKVSAELGLGGIRSVILYHGIDGQAVRNLIAVHMPGPRKGLARLANAQPFALDDLPPLPEELSSFTALRLDLATLYDGGLKLAEGLAPDQGRELKAGLAAVNRLLGIDVRQDLLGSLGSLTLTYASPGENMMFTGQTLLFEVKDPIKLQAAIDKIARQARALAQERFTFSQRDYHGVKLHMLRVHQPGFLFVPTYALHKNWLALSFYPQPVQGFILRELGELPAWKPGPVVQAHLQHLPKKFLYFAWADPRPTIKFLLAWTPLAVGGFLSTQGDVKFDLSFIPNAYSITKHLFPSVTVADDDGTTLRVQSLSSLPLPPGFESIDSSAVMVTLAAISLIGQNAEATFKEVEGRIEPVPPRPRK